MLLYGLFSPTIAVSEQLARQFGDPGDRDAGTSRVCDAGVGLGLVAGWRRSWESTQGGFVAATSRLEFWDAAERIYRDADRLEIETASALVEAVLQGRYVPALDVPWVAADQDRRSIWLFGSSAGGSTIYFSRLADETLVWSTRPNRFDFARRAALDRQGVGELVRFGANYGNRTVIQGLQRIPFAHYLQITSGNPASMRPFQSFGYRPDSTLGMDEAADRARRGLETNLEVCRDRPTRLLFSGGVDSSLLAVLGRKTEALTGGTLLSMGPDDQNARIAKEFADANHLDVDVVQLRRDWSVVQDAVSGYALPTLDFAIIPTHQLGREVVNRHGSQLLVDGTGGDAWFGFGSLRHADTWRRAHRWLSWLRGTARRLSPQMMLRTGRMPALLMAAARLPNQFDPALAYLCCNPAAVAELTLGATDWKSIELSLIDLLDALGSSRDSSDLSRMILADATLIAMAQFAAKTSQWELANRAQTLYPFCMPNLVETGRSLPPALLLANGIAKPVLKKLACDTGMPREFVYRRKVGFQPPLLTILTDPANRAVVRDLLDRSDDLDEYFSPSAKAHCWNVLQSGGKVEIKALYFVWSLLGLRVWLDGFRSGNQLRIDPRPLSIPTRTGV